MKIKLLILLIIVSFSAQAQWINRNPYGLQSQNGNNNLVRFTWNTSGQFSYLPTKNYVDSLLSNSNDKITKPYLNETWAVIGDSFTQLNIFQPSLLSVSGITTLSDGIGGSCITGGTGNAQGDGVYRKPFVSRINASISKNITGIIVEGGSNDFHYNAPLGTIESTDTLTFYGSLNYITNQIASSGKPLKVFFVTPTFRPDPQLGGSSTGSANWDAMLPYVNAMKVVAQKYGYQVIDAFNSGINIQNINIYTSDTVHPDNANGKKLYGNYLANSINSNASNTVPTLEAITNVGQFAISKRPMYFQGSSSTLDNSSIILTNQSDSELRIKLSTPSESNKHASIYSNKFNNLALMENKMGDVLIGKNTTTGSRFEVEGDSRFDGYLNVYRSGTAGIKIESTDNGTDAGLRLSAKESGGGTGSVVDIKAESKGVNVSNLKFFTRNGGTVNEVGRFNELGFFGIGLNPTVALDVSGDAKISGLMNLGNGLITPLTGYKDGSFINTFQTASLSTNVSSNLPAGGGQIPGLLDSGAFTHSAPPTSTTTGKRGSVWIDPTDKTMYVWILDNTVARYLSDPTFSPSN